MGFLSGLTEKVFGGTDNSQQKLQQAANAKTQAWIEQQAALARGDANYLYPQGDYARDTGINAAMALMGNSMPTQMGMYQNGNIAAQQMLLAGMPQYQNAILGMPVNNQALQPYQSAMPDSSAYKQQLPNFNMQQAPAAGQSWGTNTAYAQQPQQFAQQPYPYPPPQQYAPQGGYQQQGDPRMAQYLGGMV